MHVVLAYHSLRRRRGCYAGNGSREADDGANVLLGIKVLSARSKNHG